MYASRRESSFQTQTDPCDIRVVSIANACNLLADGCRTEGTPYLVTVRVLVSHAMISAYDHLRDMKKTKVVCWSGLVDFLVAAGCVALISYWDHKRTRRRRTEAKLDASLEGTFPASDPLQF